MDWCRARSRSDAPCCRLWRRDESRFGPGQGALHPALRRLPRARERRHQGRPGARTSTCVQAVDRRRARPQHDRGRGAEADRLCRRAGRCRRTSSRARTPTPSPPTSRARSARRGPAPPAAGPSGTAKANAQNVVEIPADPTPASSPTSSRTPTAKAGKVTLESKNDSSVPHNIALKGGPGGRGRPGRQDLEDHRRPEGRQAHLLLQRPRPRAGRDEGHADRQIVERAPQARSTRLRRAKPHVRAGALPARGQVHDHVA